MKEAISLSKKAAVMALAIVMAFSMLCAPISSITVQKVFAAEKEVASIEFTSENGDIVFFENTGGYEDTTEEGEDFYYYDVYDAIFKDGSIITVTMEDGEKEVYAYDSASDTFMTSDGECLRGLDFNSNQYSSPWTIGGENYIYLSYMDKTCEIPVSILENTVGSINYEPAEDIVLLENTGGFTERDEDGQEFYFYDEWDARHNGDILTVTDKDGNETAYTYDEDEEKYVAENGNAIVRRDVRIDSDQYHSHWGVGENSVFVEYMGKTCEFTVAIQKNPVESISYEPANEITLMENTGGYTEYDEDDQKYYRYDEFDIPRDGDILTVTDTDGNVVSYAYNGEENRYESVDGDIIDEDMVQVKSDQYYNHWTIGGDYYVTIEYMGRTCSVPVTIVESPIKSISFELLNGGKIPENTCGEWYDDENGDKYFYYSEFAICQSGSVLSVEDNDGNVTEYTYNIDTNQYEAENGDVIDVGELNTSFIEYSDDDTYEFTNNQYWDHWTVGDAHHILITYMGRTAAVDITIVGGSVQPEDGDKEKAAAVAETIMNTIPNEVALTDEAAVMAAKAAYDALTDEQKALVSDEVKTKLNNAVSRIAELKEAAGKQDGDKTPEGSVDQAAEKAFQTKVAAAKAAKVKKLTVKAMAKKKAKITWSTVKGVSGYEIKYSIDKKFKKNVKTKTVKGAKKKTVTVKKLKAGKKYFVKIRPYTNVKDTNGKTVKTYGKWSKVAKIKAKK